VDASAPARVAGIVLAAGRGSRMGASPKQLLMLDGKFLIQHVIDSAKESQLGQLVIVLGHEHLKVRELIDEGRYGEIIVNPHYQQGQSTSIRKGIHSISPSMDAAMILLGDQPGITSAMIDQLIDAYGSKKSPLVVPRYNGKRGNPVIIDRSLFAEIDELTGDTGARALFDKHSAEIEYVNFDFRAPPDIDTMDDYERVAAKLPN
jgi:molybdenum cofactor cytidylyltransferase